MEMLNYLTSEVHKGFSPLFNPKLGGGKETRRRRNLDKKFDWLSGFLGNKSFLLGDTFTVADAYLFTLLNWTGHVKIDLGKWPILSAYQARIAQRPKVQRGDEGRRAAEVAAGRGAPQASPRRPRVQRRAVEAGHDRELQRREPRIKRALQQQLRMSTDGDLCGRGP